MGEAKRRKLIDPSFGRQKRGVVVSPPIEIQGSSLFAKSSSLDPQELRTWLLFFDNLVWPSSHSVHFGTGPEEQFLEQCKILLRPDYTVYGDGAQGIATGQVKAFRDLDAKEPGLWAFAQGENSLLLRDNHLVKDFGVALELYNAIPVPNRDVPLNDILEFRLKRRDELQLMRNELESFVKTIDLSNDREADLAKSISAIDRACSNAIQVSREWQFPVRLANLKATFELRPLVNLAAGFSAYGLGTVAGMSMTAAALSGIGMATATAAPALKIAGDFGWQGLKREVGPYRYVSQYHNELF